MIVTAHGLEEVFHEGFCLRARISVRIIEVWQTLTGVEMACAVGGFQAARVSAADDPYAAIIISPSSSPQAGIGLRKGVGLILAPPVRADD